MHAPYHSNHFQSSESEGGQLGGDALCSEPLHIHQTAVSGTTSGTVTGTTASPGTHLPLPAQPTSAVNITRSFDASFTGQKRPAISHSTNHRTGPRGPLSNMIHCETLLQCWSTLSTFSNVHTSTLQFVLWYGSNWQPTVHSANSPNHCNTSMHLKWSLVYISAFLTNFYFGNDYFGASILAMTHDSQKMDINLHRWINCFDPADSYICQHWRSRT